LLDEKNSVFSSLFMAPSASYYILNHVSYAAVYDVSIAYKDQLPTFLDNVFGTDPSEVHIHVQRIPVKDIPASNAEAAKWLMDRFQLKDQLLLDFKARGHFPNEGTEQELSTLKCLVNFTVVILLTALFIYLTFFSSVWFKTYASLACAYLASATHFKFRPLPVTKLL
jgi:lysocardiolipin and lysophospholipid acyltransferase